MAEKRLNTRIIHKHETEANWLLSSLVPLQGELIVYDIDENYNYERIKIGDGVQNVNALPFVDDDKQDKDFVVNLTAGKLSADKTFAEITAAYNAGRHVIAKRFTMQFPLIVLSDEMAIFALEIVKDMSYIHFYCSSDDVWQESSGNSMPDIGGQIGVHNSDTTAHNDIRTAVSDLGALVGGTKVSEQIAAANIIYIGQDRPTDPNIKVWINTAEEGTGVIPMLPRVSTITLAADGWTGNSAPYSQVVEINTATPATKVELNPTAMQIVNLQNDDIALMAQNDAGTITVYSFGGKPSVSMAVQVTLTEVSYV